MYCRMNADKCVLKKTCTRNVAIQWTFQSSEWIKYGNLAIIDKWNAVDPIELKIIIARQ